MFRKITNSCYRYNREYCGPLQAAILDWSGTTVDKYVIAPAVVFQDVFERQGVPITMAEARGPMGLRKDLHILEITKNPEVRLRWAAVHAREPSQSDVDVMYSDFIPRQLDCLTKYSELLPGVSETVNQLRKEFGLKIGSTTGFNKEMVDVLLEDARLQGYQPDASVAGDEVENGSRPKPFMLYRNMELLDVHPIQSVLKVDDTVGGVGEGLEAGCWTVGLSRYSNYMDIDSLEHEKSLSNEEIEYRHEISRDTLLKSGAHYVVDDLMGLPDVVRDINSKLANGEKP